MMNEIQYRAMSDLSRLIAMFLNLPSRELATGLVDGRLQEDILVLQDELGWPAIVLPVTAVREQEQTVKGDSMAAISAMSDDVWHSLRQEYTRLFTHPEQPCLRIYEALFRYEAEGKKGARPVLQISPAALDAQRLYDQAGFSSLYKAYESPDHMGREVEFWAYLCYRFALDVAGEPPLNTVPKTDLSIASAVNLQDVAAAFCKLHVQRWWQSFFVALEAKSELVWYQVIARLGQRLTEAIIRG